MLKPFGVRMLLIRFGRVAQRESTGLTSRGSQVQILFRLPFRGIWMALRRIAGA